MKADAALAEAQVAAAFAEALATAPAEAPPEAPAEAPAAEVWPLKLEYLLEWEWVFNELKEKPVKQL